jgi:hypothetical protein
MITFAEYAKLDGGPDRGAIEAWKGEGGWVMPSKSPSQARLMAAAAHTPGGYGGVSQKVGREFNQADKGGKLLSRAEKNRGKKKAKK